MFGRRGGTTGKRKKTRLEKTRKKWQKSSKKLSPSSGAGIRADRMEIAAGKGGVPRKAFWGGKCPGRRESTRTVNGLWGTLLTKLH